MVTIFDLKQGFAQNNALAEVVLTLDNPSSLARGHFALPEGGVLTDQVVGFTGTARNVSGNVIFGLNNGAGQTDAISEDGSFELSITVTADADTLLVQGSHIHCEFTDLVITIT